MTTLKKLEAVHEDYFREHPEEIDDYLTEIFIAYAEDDDTTAFLSQLRLMARLLGVSEISQTLFEGNPRLETIAAILKAMGYKLTIQPLEQHS